MPSALTSTSMNAGMSVGRHFTVISRTMGCRMPPSATPTGLPMKCSGTVTCEPLGQIDLVEVDVQDRAA